MSTPLDLIVCCRDWKPTSNWGGLPLNILSSNTTKYIQFPLMFTYSLNYRCFSIYLTSRLCRRIFLLLFHCSLPIRPVLLLFVMSNVMCWNRGHKLMGPFSHGATSPTPPCVACYSSCRQWVHMIHHQRLPSLCPHLHPHLHWFTSTLFALLLARR